MLKDERSMAAEWIRIQWETFGNDVSRNGLGAGVLRLYTPVIHHTGEEGIFRLPHHH
jgi:hypothetical protein